MSAQKLSTVVTSEASLKEMGNTPSKVTPEDVEAAEKRRRRESVTSITIVNVSPQTNGSLERT